MNTTATETPTTRIRLEKEFMLVLAVLDCAIREKPEWLACVTTWFKPEFINDMYYRSLYEKLVQLHTAGSPVSARMLAVAIHDTRKSYGESVLQYESMISDSASQGGHLSFYAKEVFQEYRRVHASSDLGDAASTIATAHDPDEILERLPEITTKYAPPPEDRVRDHVKVIEEILEEMEGKVSATRLDTGIHSLDARVDGVAPTDLVTVGARTSNGKSVFLGQCAIRAADREDGTVLFFSLEMGAKELTKRWASVLSRQQFKGGDRTQFLVGMSRVAHLMQNNCVEVFTGSKTVESITATAVRYAATCKVRLIVVDYVQAVTPSGPKSDGREQQVRHIAQSLKALAMKCGVPVVTASQLNKSGESSPQLSSIRESEAITFYSNLVLLLEPESQDGAHTNVNINIAKYRDGAKGVVVCKWDRPIFTMRDLDAYDMANYDRSFD